MKHCLSLVLLLIFSVLSLSGANPRADVMLSRLSHHFSETDRGLLRPLSDESAVDSVSITHYPVILDIEGDAEPVLSKLNAVVWGNRGSLYLTCIPVEHLDEIPRDKGIDGFQPAVFASASLDVARVEAGVDDAHRLLSKREPLNAVVTGICDIGFDPRHEVFSDCLKRWVVYDEYHGVRSVYDGYDNIVNNAPATDTDAGTHATHVGGILAGYAEGSPYYGVAPSSDFVATVSHLSDVAICAGIEDIIAYAKQTGRPAVVNISAGSYLGPHDGKDLVGRYLSALSEDAVICFSAGNYGARNNCQSLDLDDYDDPIGSAWCDMTWLGLDVYGGTDAWSGDDTPFEFRLVAWDLHSKEFVYVTDWMGGDGTDGEFFFDLEKTPWFDSGGVWASWGVYPDNNRFSVAFEYDYSTSALQPGYTWSRYAVGYHIRKVADNTHVDVYADGIRSFLHGMGIKGCVRGDADGSISNLASCPDVIAVGAWNSRAVVPDIETGRRQWAVDVDRVAPWSAYGTTADGRHLPHICAPGNTLVSAMSTPHSNTEISQSEDSFHTAYMHNGYKYYAEAGTSMASPMVAGIAALWLEADPGLDVHRIRQIAMSSARRDFDDIADPRWGAGAIDAMAGLKSILSVDNISADTDSLPIVSISGGTVTACWVGCKNPIIKVYDVVGRSVTNGHLRPATLYIVEVINPNTGTKCALKTTY